MVKSFLNYVSQECDAVTIEHNNAITLLKDVVRLGTNLPAHVFHKKFERYFGLYIVTHEAYLLKV